MDRDNVIIDTLTECIKEARSMRGLSNTELAERSGIHVRTIRKIEAGDINPSFRVLYPLVHVLCPSFDYSFYGVYYKRGYSPSKAASKSLTCSPYDIYLDCDLLSVGDALQAVRTLKSMTRLRLSVISDISIRSIVRIERQGTSPSFTELYSLVQALDISFDYLFRYKLPGKKYFKSIEHFVAHMVMGSALS